MKSTAQAESPSLRPFFAIWIGQAFSLLGSQLVQFALIWWMTQTTESATVLATASLVGLLPGVVLGPLVGALVDRWNRRVTMIVADGLIALATVGLALLFWSGWIQIWHVYLLMFVRAVAGGFHWPAMQASTSLMVPKTQLGRIQGLNQMLSGGLNIASAPLGALLLEVLPMQGVLAIDVVTALLAIVPLFLVIVPQPLQPETSAAVRTDKPSLWQDLCAGLRYVWHWPGLLMIMLLATVINLVLNPAFALLPILVVRHFGGGAIQLGGLESAWGVGVVLGGLLLSAWGGFRRQILTSLVGLLGLGLSTLVIGLTPAASFILALGGMFAVGLMMPIVNGPILALLQGLVAPEMQGRVFTLLSSFASAASPLGLAVAGPVADALGVRLWFVLGGVVTMLMGVTGFFIPAVMRIEAGVMRIEDGVMRIEDRPPRVPEDGEAVPEVLAGQGARAEA
jgi:MFS transporter, DHA3 family, macrolide efflux protein